MLKNRLKYILIILVAVIIIFIVAGIFLSSRDDMLSIQNNTDITISGLKIKYSNFSDDVKVPEILPKKVYKTKLRLPENFSEGSIKIFYIDKNGKNHEEYLSGYIEKGYKVKINSTIDSVDNNGVLTIKIK